MIKLNNINYQYDNFNLHIDLTIAAQEKVVIVGPSGAGKSTLLSLLAGFIFPQSGEILLNNQNMQSVMPGKRPISMLFQENNLFSHLTVLQNIALGIKPSLTLSPQEQHEINEILKRVGLEGYAHRYPENLSGGQKQRVALARCLIQHRPILLLDEPFSALDQALRYEMMTLVDDICNEFGLTLMMVSHYLDESLSYFTRCLVLEQGHIIFNHHPQKLSDPQFESMAKLLGLIKS